MVWMLPCVHSPCLGLMYSLKGCFHSPSKQKLGEGLAKLRTAREAPADCVCPPGECQGTSIATLPQGCLPAAHTTESPLLLCVFLFLQENVLRSVFSLAEALLCLRLVNVSQRLALACLQIKEFEVWTKVTFGYKNKRVKNLTGLWALGVGPKQFRSSNKIAGA